MQHRLLIVDDEINSAKYLARILGPKGYTVDCAGSGEDGLTALGECEYDLLLVDMILPGMNGLEFLKHAKEICPEAPIVIITAYGSITSAVDALKAGASDFVEKPVVPEKLVLILVRLLEERRLKRELTTLKADLYQRYKFGAIIGKHPKMIKIYALIESLRDMDSSVLITGETGTGKDITARAIHFESHRRNGPFVAINCASVPETLLESELFGYERGAFTGAARRKYGKIEQAHGGTLFLDEIGDMPYPLQSKLLRTMQDKQIERLGSNKSISLDFRIISATNKDLPHELAEKRFRLDLFYRISVAPIHLPPLRERPEDIPLLVDHFLEKLAEKMNRTRPELSPKAMADLMNHHWPGNVRELENVLELAIILNPNRMIEDVPISPLYSPDACETARPAFGIDTGMALKELKDHVLAHVEREYFTELLKKNRGSIARTASDAQIDVRTVLRKIRQYGLSKADYK